MTNWNIGTHIHERISRQTGRALMGLAILLLACCSGEEEDTLFAKLSGPFADNAPLQRPLGPYTLKPVRTEMIPARDGIRLSTDIYLPEGQTPTEAILIRTPYGKQGFKPETSKTGTVATFVEHGYAVLVQDHRGKFGSEGQYRPTYRDDLDGYDTMDWIIKQPWSNGVIGTFGCSSLGENQVNTAHLKHPAWKAAIPMSSSGANGTIKGRDHHFAHWNGGAFELAMGQSWFADNGMTSGPDAPPSPDKLASKDLKLDFAFLPINEALRGTHAETSEYEAFVLNPPHSAYWEQYPYLKGDETVAVPALFIGSWYDYGPQDMFIQYDHFRNNSGDLAGAHRILIDPGIHCYQHFRSDPTVSGGRALGDARLNYFGLYLAWFDHWLRGKPTGVEDLPPVSVYTMGENRWTSGTSWPFKDVALTPFFLTSPGKGGPKFGGLSEEPPVVTAQQTYQYDPTNPAPTLAAPVCCTRAADGSSLEGSFDQSAILGRPDVLIFESETLTQPLDVTGPVTVTLYVSSDAPDTDFTAKLVDVYPDGRAFNILDGIQRMRWRHRKDVPAFMTPGEVYIVDIDLQATSNVFLTGHKLRLEVSSSNFPRFTRNLNTKADPHASTQMQVATNTVHLSSRYSSHITLPIREPLADLN